MNILGIAVTPYLIIGFYLTLVNIYGFVIMGVDKHNSIRRKRRIPEKNLFMTALFGGALGVYLGMGVFHHKTLHKKFKFGIPALFAFNIIILVFIFNM